MMKRTVILMAIFLMGTWIHAQRNHPVSWDFSVKKVKDKTFDVQLKATMEPGWHLFSQQQPEDAIGIPTGIRFNPNPLFTVAGKVKEIGKLEKYKDSKLGLSANQYSGTVTFVQTIKLKAGVKTSISGEVEYQTCDDKKCLPPRKVPFNLAIK